VERQDSVGGVKIAAEDREEAAGVAVAEAWTGAEDTGGDVQEGEGLVMVVAGCVVAVGGRKIVSRVEEGMVGGV
jgi:hypothetical protein